MNQEDYLARKKVKISKFDEKYLSMHSKPNILGKIPAYTHPRGTTEK